MRDEYDGVRVCFLDMAGPLRSRLRLAALIFWEAVRHPLTETLVVERDGARGWHVTDRQSDASLVDEPELQGVPLFGTLLMAHDAPPRVTPDEILRSVSAHIEKSGGPHGCVVVRPELRHISVGCDEVPPRPGLHLVRDAHDVARIMGGAPVSPIDGRCVIGRHPQLSECGCPIGCISGNTLHREGCQTEAPGAILAG